MTGTVESARLSQEWENKYFKMYEKEERGFREGSIEAAPYTVMLV